MDADAIRRFELRDWQLLECSKLRARAERYRSGGPEACVAAAAELRERWRRRRPGVVAPDRRSADLRHHIDFIKRLDEIADGIGGR